MTMATPGKVDSHGLVWIKRTLALECDWPKTRPFAERLFADVPAEEAFKIAARNVPMREGIKVAGCGIIQGIFQVGSLPHDLTMKNMELFAWEVMPALRAEFA